MYRYRHIRLMHSSFFSAFTNKTKQFKMSDLTEGKLKLIIISLQTDPSRSNSTLTIMLFMERQNIRR